MAKTKQKKPSKSRLLFCMMFLLFMIMLLQFLQLISQRRRTRSVFVMDTLSNKSNPAFRLDSSLEVKAISISDDNRPKYHPVTYASHGGSDERFCMSLESAARHGIQLKILGWGVPWQGLFQKLEAAMNLTASLPTNDVVLFVDAFDVFFTNTSSQVESSS